LGMAVESGDMVAGFEPVLNKIFAGSPSGTEYNDIFHGGEILENENRNFKLNCCQRFF